MKQKAILISIRPQYAELVCRGIKTIELRRKFPKEASEGTKVIVYATQPLGAVIGEFKIRRVHRLSIKELWGLSCISAMISWKEFNTYFKGCDFGYGIESYASKRYMHDLPLTEIYSETKKTIRPPQSFIYI